MSGQKPVSRMRIAIRLIGGFACVSLLVVVACTIGQAGFAALALREDAADMADTLVDHAYRCRLAADAWQLDGNPEHLDEARELVAGANGQANELADHFGLNQGKDSEDKQKIREAIGAVSGQFEAWLTAFEETAGAEGSENPSSEGLARAGLALQQQTEGLRQALRAARDSVRIRSAVFMFAMAPLAVGLGLLLAILLTRSILVPLNKCTATLVALRDGRFPEPCDVQSQDEFGQMAAAINDLVSTCRQSIREPTREPEPV